MFQDDSPSFLKNWTLAQLSTIFTVTVTQPYDTVLTKIQIQATKSQADYEYKSSYDCLKKVFRNEGIKGLYAGYNATAVRAVFGSVV